MELRTLPGSFSALCVSYYTSSDFRGLKASTQAVRRNILERFRAEHGPGQGLRTHPRPEHHRDTGMPTTPIRRQSIRISSAALKSDRAMTAVALSRRVEVELISALGTGTNLDIAAADQKQAKRDQDGETDHPMRCIFHPHLGKVAIAYFSPSKM